MLAMSFPTLGLNNLDANIENADKVMCSFISDDCFQRISQGHMDQIRNTMIRHEELFKEQVQALHELYSIQKSAMQQIRQAAYSQGHMLASSSDTISDLNSQAHSFTMEEQPIKSCNVASQGYSVVPHFPQRSIRSLVSVRMSENNFKTLPIKDNFSREIDLEKPPEDCMEDSEIQAEINGNQQDMSTQTSEQTRMTFQDSNVGSNFLSVLQECCSNLNQVDSRPHIIKLPERSNASQQSYDKTSETTVPEVNSTRTQNLNQASENNILKDFLCNHIRAVQSFPAHDKSSLPNHHAEEPLCLYQGGLVFATQKSSSSAKAKEPVERTVNKVEEGSNLVNLEVCQTRERDCLVENRNLDCAVNESNDRDSEGGKVSKSGGISIFKMKSNLTFETGCGKPVLMRQVRAEGMQSETEAETRTSNSSSSPSYTAKPMDQSNCSNGDPENIASQEEPAAVTENNSDTENEITPAEACESIAARILLSFTPGKTQENTKGEGYLSQIRAEPNRDAVCHDRKRSLRARRSINYFDEDFVDGTVKWTKPLPRRRRSTLRRT